MTAPTTSCTALQPLTHRALTEVKKKQSRNPQNVHRAQFNVQEVKQDDTFLRDNTFRHFAAPTVALVAGDTRRVARAPLVHRRGVRALETNSARAHSRVRAKVHV